MRRLLRSKIQEDVFHSDDFYSDTEDLLDDDEVSAEEEAFMRGYQAAK